jgi:hypothetical protein
MGTGALQTITAIDRVPFLQNGYGGTISCWSTVGFGSHSAARRSSGPPSAQTKS